MKLSKKKSKSSSNLMSKFRVKLNGNDVQYHLLDYARVTKKKLDGFIGNDVKVYINDFMAHYSSVVVYLAIHLQIISCKSRFLRKSQSATA